jgi:hypothetical protein
MAEISLRGHINAVRQRRIGKRRVPRLRGRELKLSTTPCRCPRGIHGVEDRFACQPPARQSATGDGGAGCASTISQLSPVRPRMSLSLPPSY